MDTPAGLSPRAEAFWNKITEDFTLTLDTVEILHEACATISTIDRLAEVLDSDGLMATGSKGQIKPHPALAEIRAQRGSLQRLLKALEVPDDDDEPEAPRSPADIRRSERASHAANRRWQRG